MPQASSSTLDSPPPANTPLQPASQTVTLEGAGDITLTTLCYSPDEPLPAFPPHADAVDMGTRRRRHFLAGRWCADHALAQAGHGQWHLDRDEFGLPQWPHGWLGSISHTQGKAMAAVAPVSSFAALGIDVERLMPPERAERLQRRIAAAEELAVLTDLDTADGVTLVFSAKEALYKALYPRTRRFMGFDAARLRHHCGHLLTFELTRNWCSEWPRGHEIDVRFCFGAWHVHSIASAPRH